MASSSAFNLSPSLRCSQQRQKQILHQQGHSLCASSPPFLLRMPPQPAPPSGACRIGLIPNPNPNPSTYQSSVRCAASPSAVQQGSSTQAGTKEFNLDGGLKLQVKVSGATGVDSARVEFQIPNCRIGSLLLHWAVTKDGRRKWQLPKQSVDGSRNFNNTALQTPFSKAGDAAVLNLNILDTKVDAVEFILRDESGDRWIKLNGGNFRVEIPKPDTSFSQVSIPEELVQIQSYLRWERNGKQNYSPEQQSLEYEEARKELQLEISRGATLESLKAKLLGGGGGDTSGKNSSSSTASAVPDDLVQVQAYIRWEKAGKPNYSPDEQEREFKAARKELDNELRNGLPLESLRKRLQPAGKPGKVGAMKARTVTRIQRKKRELSDIINKFSLSQAVAVDVDAPAKPTKEPTLLEMGAQIMEGIDKGAVLMRKTFKIGSHDLLVLVTNPEGEVRARLATNMTDPLSLHWGISKDNDGEWLIPPEASWPSNTIAMNGVCETPFQKGFAGEPTLQSLEIFIGDAAFRGLPFVLHSGDRWYKNNDSDFYIPLRAEPAKPKRDLGSGEGVASWFLNQIAEQESEAQRSLMHRFNIAADLTQSIKNKGELALAGLLVWMRFMATRQLIWNKNYNVKPREISAAQDRLTDILTSIYRDEPQYREITRLIMSTVGRGAQGDVGQRIRDEILVIQRNNDCKGAMMEEWHQKLHNNTSPDDVIICQALLDFIQNDMNIEVYWKTLISNGVSKQRLASYDRPIVSEPRFRHDQKEGLLRDLGAYMKTLKAVHSGADLESAIAVCMGYSVQGKDFMKSVQFHPIGGLSSQLPELLRFILEHVEDKQVIPLVEALLEARQELRPTLLKNHDRLKDIIFLDLALDSTLRTAVERGLEHLSTSKPEDIIQVIGMVLENLCLSLDKNEEFIYCLKDWHSVATPSQSGKEQWALRAKSVLDRTRMALADKAEYYQAIFQPSAVYLGGLLGCEPWAVDIFTEEIIRAGSAAALSQLLNRLDPVLRSMAHLGSWQVISPVEVRGHVVVAEALGDVQDNVYKGPTIIVANKVRGEEEIPDGAVAVLTPDMPDVLSHVSVRARNSKVCFATCFDSGILSSLRAMEGKVLKLQPTSSDVILSEITEEEMSKSSLEAAFGEAPPPEITLKKKAFSGRFAVMAEEFNNDLVGAKSRNIANLKGKMPSFIKIPTSVALPFGVFEKVLANERNKDVAKEIADLSKALHGDASKLQDIRATVLKLQAPTELIDELRAVMKKAGMPWPGDEGKERWEQAWEAIKKVWASKWNERAYLSTRKARIDHNDLCMAVLVQEIVRADYAFVIHTTNPSNGDESEIYAEVVKGLGETLVGAYSGRALSFSVKKSDMKAPKILGFPSKRIGLFIKQSIIFRSDSNGEDLEGYAGAGLYDSVPMDKEEERMVDYSSDPLVVDGNFQRSLLTKIAEAGAAVEKLYGTAQDIEGVIKDGELYVVQTRPQM